MTMKSTSPSMAQLDLKGWRQVAKSVVARAPYAMDIFKQWKIFLQKYGIGLQRLNATINSHEQAMLLIKLLSIFCPDVPEYAEDHRPELLNFSILHSETKSYRCQHLTS
jgi:hypothetical protein